MFSSWDHGRREHGHFVINMTLNSWKCYNVTRISNKSLDVRTKAVSWLGFGALTAAARVRFPAWELYHVLELVSIYLLRGISHSPRLCKYVNSLRSRKSRTCAIRYAWIRYWLNYMTFNSWKCHVTRILKQDFQMYVQRLSLGVKFF